MPFTSKLVTPTKDAFHSVLEETRDPLCLYHAPAYVSLIRLATLNGIVPFQYAMASLMTREASLLSALIGHHRPMLVAPDTEEFCDCNILVTHSPFGKLSLYLRDQEAPLNDEILLGGLKLEQALLDLVEDDCVVQELLEQQERHNIDAILAAWQAQGELDQRINQVMDWVDRVESVYIYSGRLIFTRSDIGENTLTAKPHGILRTLSERSLSEWKPEERILIVALHALFLTGRAIRFEEFNGRQLTAVQIRRWLMEKLCSYCMVLHEEVPRDPATMSVLDLAARVGQLAQRVDTSGWTRFRRINGVTLVKREQLLPPEKMVPSQAPLPIQISRIAAQLRITLDANADSAESLKEITRAALYCYIETGQSEFIHQIIERIVLSAVIQAKADYGMSSSVRAPSRLKGTSEQRIAGVLTLTKPDFYCCVLPHPQITKDLPEQVVYHMLFSSAQRMEFNRWHFVPGNFSREEIPLNRHYYFPPMMPDIAEWSDLRHGGHTKAGVRYSVRVPGAPLWRGPFMAYDHPHRGCYDIRLVRIEGPPFGEEALQIARIHCNFMDTFWKTLQEVVEAYEIVTPLVTAYTKDWYQNAQWKNVLEACAAGN